MQEEPKKPSPADKLLSTAVIWRLTQVVLVLAAAYLYFSLGSFGGLLQQNRLIGNPHSRELLQAVLVGIALGLCLGFALKDLSSGKMALVVDWPTLIINLLAAGVFVVVSFSLNFAALANVASTAGPIKDAVTLSPLVPFVWVGLTLTTLIQPRPAS